MEIEIQQNETPDADRENAKGFVEPIIEAGTPIGLLMDNDHASTQFRGDFVRLSIFPENSKIRNYFEKREFDHPLRVPASVVLQISITQSLWFMEQLAKYCSKIEFSPEAKEAIQEKIVNPLLNLKASTEEE